MFLTVTFVLVWTLLYGPLHLWFFIRLCIVVLFVEILIALKFRWTDRSKLWLSRSRERFVRFTRRYRSEARTVSLSTSVRQSMLLRVQRLFRRPVAHADKQPNRSECSLWSYRCPVCFNRADKFLRWIALGCGHILCSSCTQHIYCGTKQMCPTCRSPMVLSDLTILYL